MIFSGENAVRVKTNEPLKLHASIGIGGPADYYFEARTVSELVWAVESAKEQNINSFIIGDGSNILFSDDGYRGLVVRFVANQITIGEVVQGKATVKAEAATSWDELVSLCVQKKLAGIECLSGIPGSVGAAPVQNIGAYGQEVSETISTVEVYDFLEHKIGTLDNATCGFGYRHSNFKSLWRGRYVVLAVIFSLMSQDEGSVRYEELRTFLETKNELPTLGNIRNAVLSLRRRKAMLLDALDPMSKSVGSFFTNPTVSKEEAARLTQQMEQEGLTLVSWPMSTGLVKLSAAWLIEQAGFPKGYSAGAVCLSPKQALAIVNLKDASAADVVTLASKIQKAVMTRFSVRLYPEAQLVGFTDLPSDFLNPETVV